LRRTNRYNCLLVFIALSQPSTKPNLFMETEPVFKKLNEDMRKSVDHVLHEFSTLHTGKANPSMVEGVSVDVYGSNMKLRDVAAITTPDSRTIQIQAWDKGTVGPIEKALLEAKLGITPLVTGELIRLPIPELSGERRESYARWLKDLRKMVGLEYEHRARMDSIPSRLYKRMDYQKMTSSEPKKRYKS